VISVLCRGIQRGFYLTARHAGKQAASLLQRLPDAMHLSFRVSI